MHFWEQTSCTLTCRFNFGHFMAVATRYRPLQFLRKPNYSSFIDSEKS